MSDNNGHQQSLLVEYIDQQFSILKNEIADNRIKLRILKEEFSRLEFFIFVLSFGMMILFIRSIW